MFSIHCSNAIRKVPSFKKLLSNSFPLFRSVWYLKEKSNGIKNKITCTDGSIVEDDDRNDEDGINNDCEFTKPNRSTKKPLNRGRKSSKRQKEDLLLQKAVKTLEKVTSEEKEKMPSDADDIFGQYVASELKSIKDEYTKKFIKHRFQTVLFESQVPSFPSHQQFRPFPMFTGTQNHVNQPFDNPMSSPHSVSPVNTGRFTPLTNTFLNSEPSSPSTSSSSEPTFAILQ